jgi:transglutaminase-like putative cysteine protease
MRLHTGCDLTFDITVPTPFVLMLRPRSGAQQWIASDKFTLVPRVPVTEFTDTYGNLCQRLLASPGAFFVSTGAEVILADSVDRAQGAPIVEIQDLPHDVLIYLLPSRYCEAERFGQMALEITAGQLLGFDQVAAIEAWVRRTIRYESCASDIPVSAVEVNLRQWGVCRDLAHLAIALCRSLCIPARMVVGYLYGLEPMDLHAWFEAYLAGRWYTFDATQETVKGGYVVLGYGRDAADVAVYNQFGPAVYPVTKSIRVQCIEDTGSFNL